MAICDITPSIKTKLAMIALIGPRLVNPKARFSEFKDMFRYAEEKEKVEEILRARTEAVNANAFKGSNLNIAPSSRQTTPASSFNNKPTKPFVMAGMYDIILPRYGLIKSFTA